MFFDDFNFEIFEFVKELVSIGVGTIDVFVNENTIFDKIDL